jgi:hypothetical protein
VTHGGLGQSVAVPQCLQRSKSTERTIGMMRILGVVSCYIGAWVRLQFLARESEP